jgi:predicted  nucleic acid-binding Zn-ribbon protein
MSALLEKEVADYTRKRDRLAAAIRAFADWLDDYQGIDLERNLRLIEISDALRQDRLTLAFVAEFSRGKTELINALFFADFGMRLLPSDAGRTTMCPTEIFHDGAEAPSLKLLPIETRLRPESLGQLKLTPIEWVKMELKPDNPGQMQATLRKLTEVRRVPTGEAVALGLFDPEDEEMKRRVDSAGQVEVPAWRYGLVNLPHPMLKAGLAILDTPGLNALGSEPELTLSSIPGAHAVFFLLGTDTGVTRSDLEIWQRHVHKHVNYHVAVLNKIDMLWDDLKGDVGVRASIQRQLSDTAQVLKLPENQVFAVSAQKALLAKVRQDGPLLERSGINALEHLLGKEIIPARREIMCRGAVTQVSGQVKYYRADLMNQIREGVQTLQQLSGLSGRNRELVVRMREQLLKDKEHYDATAHQFKTTRHAVQQYGDQLLEQLSPNALHGILEDARSSMGDSWTTSGLIGAMREVSRQITDRFVHSMRLSKNIQDYLNIACERFHKLHGMPKMVVPSLDLRSYRMRIESLLEETEAFCSDPANLLVEKRFMIRRFYSGVAEEARKTYDLATKDSERWLRIALDPIVVQIREHRQLLDNRLENMRKVLTNVDDIQGEMEAVKGRIDSLRKRKAELDAIVEQMAL